MRKPDFDDKMEEFEQSKESIWRSAFFKVLDFEGSTPASCGTTADEVVAEYAKRFTPKES